MLEKKEYIIEKAFEVFMSKGYDSASMTVLHKELNMSRGAMYRYFPSKDDLFIAVVDKYIFGLLNKIQPNFDLEELSLAERIDKSYKYIQNIGKYLDNIENMEIRFLNFTALTIQAAKKYPNFIEKMKGYREKTRKSWKKTLLKAIENNEIREDLDVDILAKIFSKGNNFIEDTEDSTKFFIKGIRSGKKEISYIYSLIKK